MDQAFQEDIFKIRDERTFRAAALEVFRFQADSVPVYRDYLSALGVDPCEREGNGRDSLPSC